MAITRSTLAASSARVGPAPGADLPGETDPRLVGLAFGPAATGVEERADECTSVVPMASHPLGTGFQASPPVDVVVGASFGIPHAGGDDQLAFANEIGPGLLEPAHEPWPGPEHDLVDDLDRRLAPHDEAGGDERVDGGQQLVRNVVDRHATSRPQAFVGDIGEAQQQPSDLVAR